ncbi:MAG: M56 family metallopeptidase [Bacteroidetes bacterium]|nr:M56 family metallopeptidase [Bacteroidota bacterium]
MPHQPTWLQHLGWALIDSLWQMALLWLIYILITWGEKKFAAATRHFLSLILFAVGTLWFFFTLASAYPALNGLENGSTYNFGPLLNLPIGIRQLIYDAIPYGSGIYLLILCLLLVRYGNHFILSQRIRRSGLQKPSAEIKLFVQEMISRIGIHQKLTVWLSSAIHSPMVIGFIKPVILIPMATVNHLNLAQMDAVLLHELAHIKRHDYLINLLVAFLETIFFFNPFAWMLSQAIKKESEHACDDIVIQFRYDPCLYASALLSLEKQRKGWAQLAMAAVGKNKKLLLLRISRITNTQKKYSPDWGRFPFLGLLAIMAIFISLMHDHKKIPETSPLLHLQIAESASVKPSQKRELILISEPKESPIKRKTIIKKTKTRANLLDNDKQNSYENELTLTNNHPEYNDANQYMVNTAMTTSTEAYTMPPAIEPLPPISVSLSRFPYVPTESFNYVEIEDTSLPKPLLSQTGDLGNEAQLSMEKAMMAIQSIDWEKIEKEIKDKQINITKLQHEIQKSLKLLDWGSINNQVDNAVNEANEKRLRNDLQIQLQTLENIKYKDYLKAKQLQQQILQQQLKLQQAIIEKQQNWLRQAEELQRRLRIIYI